MVGNIVSMVRSIRLRFLRQKFLFKNYISHIFICILFTLITITCSLLLRESGQVTLHNSQQEVRRY